MEAQILKFPTRSKKALEQRARLSRILGTVQCITAHLEGEVEEIDIGSTPTRDDNSASGATLALFLSGAIETIEAKQALGTMTLADVRLLRDVEAWFSARKSNL